MSDVKVFVLDKKKNPLMTCSPKRAREMLRDGKAVVHRLVPFTIRHKYRIGGEVQPVALCIDPGATHTGIAIVRESEPAMQPDDPDARGPERHPLFKEELEHRGDEIKKGMERRKGYRRIRRSSVRYREERYSNRRHRGKRLQPSLNHRPETVMTMVRRFCKLVPVSRICLEKVNFDTQKMQNAEIEGAEYQRGTLKGTTLRAYVLERDGHQCVYCGKSDVPLEMEHVRCRSGGGARRPSNIVSSCHACNQKKGTQSVEEFMKKHPDRLAKILALLQEPLRATAAVNATKEVLHRELLTLGVPVEVSDGARTAWNRERLEIPKSHANDAICVGRVSAVIGDRPTLYVKCRGRGDYCRTKVNKHGIKRGYCLREKHVHGVRTGDLARAVVTSGKKQGVYVGRVAIRKRGGFDIATANGKFEGLSHRFFTVLQRDDGYEYRRTPARSGGATRPANVVFARRKSEE